MKSGELAYYISSSGEEIPVKILSRKGNTYSLKYTGKSRARWTHGEIFDGSVTYVIRRSEKSFLARTRT